MQRWMRFKAHPLYEATTRAVRPSARIALFRRCTRGAGDCGCLGRLKPFKACDTLAGAHPPDLRTSPCISRHFEHPSHRRGCQAGFGRLPCVAPFHQVPDRRVVLDIGGQPGVLVQAKGEGVALQRQRTAEPPRAGSPVAPVSLVRLISDGKVIDRKTLLAGFANVVKEQEAAGAGRASSSSVIDPNSQMRRFRSGLSQ